MFRAVHLLLYVNCWVSHWVKSKKQRPKKCKKKNRRSLCGLDSSQTNINLTVFLSLFFFFFVVCFLNIASKKVEYAKRLEKNWWIHVKNENRTKTAARTKNFPTYLTSFPTVSKKKKKQFSHPRTLVLLYCPTSILFLNNLLCYLTWQSVPCSSMMHRAKFAAALMNRFTCDLRVHERFNGDRGDIWLKFQNRRKDND